jgi:hydroxymethylglutaryl-CoA reductase (NADPH)
MSTDYRNLKILMQEIRDEKRIERIIKQQNQEHQLEVIWTRDHHTAEGQEKRLDFLEERNQQTYEKLRDNAGIDNLDDLKGNIENFIGFSKIPTGIAGPLLINGTEASGQFFVPLATTEGALVASYNRGCKAASKSGGIRSICITESVQRSPIFRFERIIELGQFWLGWFCNMKNLKKSPVNVADTPSLRI